MPKNECLMHKMRSMNIWFAKFGVEELDWLVQSPEVAMWLVCNLYQAHLICAMLNLKLLHICSSSLPSPNKKNTQMAMGSCCPTTRSAVLGTNMTDKSKNLRLYKIVNANVIECKLLAA